jgi:hypothetical protein
MYSAEVVSFIPNAYRLALAALGDREVVLRVVHESLDGISLFMREQQKNRDLNALNPSKPVLDEVQTFQYLLYEELEEMEKMQEADAFGAGRRWPWQVILLRYLKSVVYSSINHRPYYLAVGVGSLLHDYDWKDTARLHDFILQEQDLSKTQNKRNQRLRELKEYLIDRFGELLLHDVDGNGEIHFSYRPISDDLIQVARAGMNLLIPWGSEHVIPEGLSSEDAPVPGLRSNDGKAGDRWSVWKNRSHALIDPECFSRIAAALRLKAPHQTIQIPEHSLATSSDDDSGPPVDWEALPGPTPDFYQDIFGHQRRRNRRRRDLQARIISVVAGNARFLFNVEEEDTFNCEIPASTNVIKVMAEDEYGALPLARLSLNLHREDLEETGRLRYGVRLPEGQEIIMTLLPLFSSGRQTACYTVEVVFHETQPLRFLSLSLRRLSRRMLRLFGAETWELSPGLMKTICVGAIFVVAAAVALIYQFNRNASKQGAQMTGTLSPTPFAPGQNDDSDNVAGLKRKDETAGREANKEKLPGPGAASRGHRAPHGVQQKKTPLRLADTQVASLIIKPDRSETKREAVSVNKPYLLLKVTPPTEDDDRSYNALVIEEATGRRLSPRTVNSTRTRGEAREVSLLLPTRDLTSGNYTLRLNYQGRRGVRGTWTVYLKILIGRP